MSLYVIIVTAEVVIILGLIAALAVRQAHWQYTDKRRLWGVPIILAVFGVIYLPLTVHGLVPADALLAGVELLASILVGLGIGALITVRVAAEPDRRGRRVQIRAGWKGGALWIVLIGFRFALLPVANALNAELVTSTGVILILVAVARATLALKAAPLVNEALARTSTSVPVT